MINKSEINKIAKLVMEDIKEKDSDRIKKAENISQKNPNSIKEMPSNALLPQLNKKEQKVLNKIYVLMLNKYKNQFKKYRDSFVKSKDNLEKKKLESNYNSLKIDFIEMFQDYFEENLSSIKERMNNSSNFHSVIEEWSKKLWEATEAYAFGKKEGNWFKDMLNAIKAKLTMSEKSDFYSSGKEGEGELSSKEQQEEEDFIDYPKDLVNRKLKREIIQIKELLKDLMDEKNEDMRNRLQDVIRQTLKKAYDKIDEYTLENSEKEVNNDKFRRYSKKLFRIASGLEKDDSKLHRGVVKKMEEPTQIER
ncbi:hypothetical protein M0R19_03875 [Candidatus Pacearchaeota archaeon]|nr:hypothetical protein [Candidatus Pacearchaeota archaeon]